MTQAILFNALSMILNLMVWWDAGYVSSLFFAGFSLGVAAMLAAFSIRRGVA